MSRSGRQAAVMGLAEQKSAEKVAYLTTARDDGEPRFEKSKFKLLLCFFRGCQGYAHRHRYTLSRQNFYV